MLKTPFFGLKKTNKDEKERIYLNKSCLGDLYNEQGFALISQTLINQGIDMIDHSKPEVDKEKRWFEITHKDLNLLKLILPNINSVNDNFNQFISELKSNPENFTLTAYTLTSNSLQLSIWINNGLNYYNFYSPVLSLSIDQQRIFEKIYKYWLKNQREIPGFFNFN